VPDFPTAGPLGGQLAAAGSGEASQGYDTFVFGLFLAVLVIAAFAASTFFVWNDHDLGIKAFVVGALGLAALGFMLVWRRS
jgi:hypothetical protein